MIDLDSFFSDCSRDITVANNFIAKFGYMVLFGREAFQNGLQYRPIAVGLPIYPNKHGRKQAGGMTSFC